MYCENRARDTVESVYSHTYIIAAGAYSTHDMFSSTLS